ncbi:1-aminocyclopropane-1-carboxylate deaminase/D-cysteine desulfhydrase [Undibacterium flavidum]|uniref:Pyridoxal-phosphate dependent enzyme n=1 Tax=Undibacterium flavidum TaxID=2762297 RepID=A0ABR6YGS7_9BURK|nr:pyridoxal-phosphate dependent enzyme [Undibacterium flavidum]MBC3875722.1 pyridoxal-phosphate dependent enzyme [Undibacterium flavidum]
MNFLSHSSPLQNIQSPLFPGIDLWVKRDDLLQPQVSGNKFRKLKHTLLAADPRLTTLVSMGGAWSNHLHALAHAGHILGFRTIGLVRGIPGEAQALTATLEDCRQLGMELHFVSRADYRELRDQIDHWRLWVPPESNNYLWLPEGGSSVEAVRGMAELVDEVRHELGEHPSNMIVACGTGTSLAGIVAGMQDRGRVIGIAAVQNSQYLRAQIQELLVRAEHPAYDNFDILHEFTHGGFAKTSPQLLAFCDRFFADTHIPVEPIYTGKMFYALHQLCHAGKFSAGERVVAVHTGGLQGNRGFLQS